MPPKRKRVEDSTVEAAPRATRTSSRLKSSATGTSQTTPASAEKAQKSAKAKSDGGPEAEPTATKPKRTTKATAKKGKGGLQEAMSPNEAQHVSENM